MSAKFSVLLPTHNRLELLSYAIKSVLNQTFDDFEIVISDNESKEDIKGYIEKLGDQRIKYTRTDRFLSVTENWNNALNHSSGNYIIMLGDDDALLPEALNDLSKVIDDFSSPDFIYTNCFQYGYPGVIPGQSQGFIQRPYTPLFHGHKKAYELPAEDGQRIVESSCKFWLPLVYNMQHGVVKRSLADQMRIDGQFFHSPYPDYYATNCLFLEANKIVVNPIYTAVVGISPKSFGFYYFNDLEERGNSILNNDLEDKLQEKLKDVVLPGSQMNTSWLAAMELVVQHFGHQRGLEVDYQRYRDIQVFSAIEKRGFEAVQDFSPYLSPAEIKRYKKIEKWGNFRKRLVENSDQEQYLASLNKTWFPYPQYDTLRTLVPALNIVDIFKNPSQCSSLIESEKDYLPGHHSKEFEQIRSEDLSVWWEGIRASFKKEMKMISPADWETLEEPLIRFRFPKMSKKHLVCRFIQAESQEEFPCDLKKISFLDSEFEARPKATLPPGRYLVNIYDHKTKETYNHSGVIVADNGSSLTGQIQSQWKPTFEELLQTRQSGKSEFDPGLAKSPKAPLLSLITTVYDTPLTFLEKVKEDLLGQTFQDFEWLVLDNGSKTKEVKSWVASLPNADKRIKVYRVDQNIHIIPGNRHLLEKVSGQYLIPIDSDDVLYTDSLESIAEAIEQTPEADCFYSDEHTVDTNGTPLIPYLRRDRISRLYGYSTCPFSHLSAIRVSMARSVNLYSEDYAQGSHDWDSALRLLEKKAIFKHIPKVLYGWRVHETSASSSHSAKSYALSSQMRNLQASLKRRDLERNFTVREVVQGYYHLIRLPENGPNVCLYAYVTNPEDASKLIRNLKLTRYDNLVTFIYLPKEIENLSLIEEQVSEFADTRKYEIRSFVDIKDIKNSIREQNDSDFTAILNCSNNLETPYWIWDAIGTFELDSNTGVVGGKLVDTEGKALHWGFFESENGFQELPVNYPKIEGLVPDYQLVRGNVDAIYSGFFVVRTPLIKLIDLPETLDEENAKGGVNWSAKIRSQNIDIAYTPEMTVSRNRFDSSIPL